MMRYDPKTAGEVIRRLRRSRKLTQEVFSGLADVGRSHLAEIECGSRCAGVETLWRIAEGFDMPLSELIRLIEKEMARRS